MGSLFSCLKDDEKKPDINIKSKIDSEINCGCNSSCCISTKHKKHKHKHHEINLPQ